MVDSILRLIISGDSSQAVGGVRRLSTELEKQREELKRSREAELARSQTARIGIAEQVLAEKRKQAELKNTTKSLIAAQRAEENLRSLQNRAAISTRNVQLKILEQQEAGLTGLDRYHGLLQLIPGRFGAIATSGTSAISGVTSGLSSAGIAATALTTAIGAGLVAAIAAAGVGAKYLSDQLKQASDAQLGEMGQAAEISRLYGVDQKTANRSVRSIQEQIAIAGRDTPVSTSQIQDYSNVALPAILRAFQSQGRSLQDAEKTTVGLSTRFAIAAQSTPGVTEFQIKAALASAGSGDLASAIKTQEFFRNSGLGTIIKEEAQKRGADLATASAAQQLDILQAALETKIPDSLIAQMQGSVNAQVSSFMDRLFDPFTGAFGVRRDLEQAEGEQSVFTEFSRSIELLLGKNGTLAEIGETLDKLLPADDAMADLRSGFKTINQGIDSLNQVLRDLNQLLDDIAKSPLGQLIKAIDEKIPKPGSTLWDSGIKLGSPGNSIASPAVSVNGNTGFDLKQLPFIGGAFRGTANFFSDLFGTARPQFAGSLEPSYSMPLLSAIATERANMPSGAELVVANSSEAILTPDQILQIASGGWSQNSSSNLTIEKGAIVIHAAPNMNIADLADAVIDRIDQKVEFERSTRF